MCFNHVLKQSKANLPPSLHETDIDMECKHFSNFTEGTKNTVWQTSSLFVGQTKGKKRNEKVFREVVNRTFNFAKTRKYLATYEAEKSLFIHQDYLYDLQPPNDVILMNHQSISRYFSPLNIREKQKSFVCWEEIFLLRNKTLWGKLWISTNLPFIPFRIFIISFIYFTRGCLAISER